MKPKKPTAFETDNCDEVNEEADVGRWRLVAGCGGVGGVCFWVCVLLFGDSLLWEGGSFYYCSCTILLIPVNQLKITSYPLPY